MSKLDDLIKEAIEELEEWVKDNPEADPNYDGTLHDIADSQTPIYYSTLLEIAAEDNDVALSVPELGPAFDGSATPVNIIAANIYEAIYNAISLRWNEIENEKE